MSAPATRHDVSAGGKGGEYECAEQRGDGLSCSLRGGGRRGAPLSTGPLLGCLDAMSLLLPLSSPVWWGRLLRVFRSMAGGVAAAAGRSPEARVGVGRVWGAAGSGPGAAGPGAVGQGAAGPGAAGTGAGVGAGGGFDELYRARRLGLVRLAVLMVDDLGSAEDIVQEAFAKLWRRHGEDLRGVDDPAAYLTTAVLNAARSALRRRKVARAYVAPRVGVAPAAEDLALLGEGDREVLAALGRLTARQRQVVVLRYWSELSEQEIADALRVSRGTVKSTASRALTILRGALEGRR
ncbi:SigE family RNA polymerase sigma factor [Actinoplanes sp. NPDC051470]|uniref:RNA polymerase sigma factor n=1 Tax=Actinoplanes sp. NPDC051470 TaxID=3157224 RepID=UPI00344008C6